MLLSKKKIFLGMMTWQGGHGHIDQTLQTIFNQTYYDFKLVIYDDCSPQDPSKEILSLIASEPRASFIRGSKRLGSSKASQYLLSLAPSDTDYFAWISDHDLYQKDWLLKLIKALNTNHSAAVSYPYVSGVNSDGTKNNRKPTIYDNSTQSVFERIDSFLSLESGPGNIVWGLYRYSLLKSIGGWPRLVVPDNILLSRLVTLGTFVQINENLHIRREQKERADALNSRSSSGMVSRQIKAIFPKRPLYTYIDYRIVNCIYLLLKEPIPALFKKNHDLEIAIHLWLKYNKYKLLPLWKEFPYMLVSNRLTRYVRHSLLNKKNKD